MTKVFSSYSDGTVVTAMGFSVNDSSAYPMSVSGGYLVQSNAWNIEGAWLPNTYSDNQSSIVVLPAGHAALAGSVTLAANRVGGSTSTGYGIDIGSGSSSSLYRNGSYVATLAYSITWPLASDTTLELRTTGGVVGLYVNGTLQSSYTDGTPLTGGTPYFSLYNAGTAGDAKLKSFSDGTTVIRGAYNTYTGNPTTDSSLSGVAVQQGDLVVVGCSYAVGLSSVTIADNAAGGTNSYSSLTSVASSTNGASGYMFATVAKATETLTITTTLYSDVGMWAIVYPGPYTTVAGAVSNVGSTLAESASATSHTSGSATATTGGFSVCMWWQELTGSTLSSTNGWTTQVESTTHVHHVLDVYNPYSNSVQSTATSGSSVAYNALIVAFKSPATGPTITTQPTDQSAPVGGTATFTVAGTASAGSLTYDCETSTDGGSTWSSVGAAASYTTGTLTTADNGTKFKFILSDSNGSVTSNVVTLTVYNAVNSFQGNAFQWGMTWTGSAPAATQFAASGLVSVQFTDGVQRAFLG